MTRGGTIRGACVAAITSLDPATSKLGICDLSAYSALYNTLVAVDASGTITPELATGSSLFVDGGMHLR